MICGPIFTRENWSVSMVDITRFTGGPFDPNKYAPKPIADPYETFRSVLLDAGFAMDGPVLVTADKPVRVKMTDSANKNGWYFFQIFNTDSGQQIGFGTFGDRRAPGHHTSWSSRSDQMSEPDNIRLDVERKRQAEEARRMRDAQQDEAAKVAADYLGKCTVPLGHPYLAAKGVGNHGLLQRHDALVMPLINTLGNVRSYQTILPDGQKRYLKDGQKNGCFHLIGQVGATAYIVEGYATGATVHEATGQGVFVACDTANLGPVVTAARSLYPSTRLIIAADNDANGAGHKAASKAATRDSNTVVIMVNIDPEDGTDFNDLAREKGLKPVRDQLMPLGEVKRRLLLHASELEDTPPEWIIEDVLPRDSLTVVFGESGSGKSFIALDMGLAIARGADWHGHQIDRPGIVIYICGEGKTGIKRRLRANSKLHGYNLNDVPFYVSRTSVQMLDQGQVRSLVDEIKDLADAAGLAALIIIDTYARNFGDGDENSTKDASRWVEAADLAREETGASVMVCHHSGLTEKDRMRGAGALKAAIDTEIKVAKADDGIVSIKGLKMKDGEDVAQHNFNMEFIHLGTDDKGKDYGSLVPVLTDASPGDELAKKMKRMGKHQIQVFETAQALTKKIKANNGEDADAIFTAMQLYEEIPEARRPRSDHFKRALEQLIDRELFTFQAPHYRIAEG